MSDVRRYAATVSEDSGDMDDTGNREPLAETVNASLAAEINTYIAVYQMYKNELKEILNTSDMVMGTPREYVSRHTQQQSMAASSSNVLYYFHGTMQLIADALQHAMNIRIKKIATNPTYEDEVILGKDDIEYLKKFFSKEGLKLQDIQAFVMLDDVIDEAQKQKFQDLALAFANGQMISPEDGVAMQSIGTLTELRDYFKYTFDKQNKAKAKAEMRAEQAEMIKDEANNQAKQNEVNTIAMSRDNASKTGAEASIATAAMKAGQEQPQEQMQ
jgi:hypothetical protein